MIDKFLKRFGYVKLSQIESEAQAIKDFWRNSTHVHILMDDLITAIKTNKTVDKYTEKR